MFQSHHLISSVKSVPRGNFSRNVGKTLVTRYKKKIQAYLNYKDIPEMDWVDIYTTRGSNRQTIKNS